MKKRITLFILSMLPLMGFAVGIEKGSRQFIMNITLVGILIVISALTIVSVVVGLMSRAVVHFETRDERKAEKKAAAKTQRLTSDTGNEDEEIAAVMAALHMELKELENEEKAILTIRKIVKPYSAWNNKSYGMRQPARGAWSE